MSGEMTGEDHCSMDDDPPTDGMCHPRIRRHWAEKEAFREEVGRPERRSDDAVNCRRFQCAHRCG